MQPVIDHIVAQPLYSYLMTWTQCCWIDRRAAHAGKIKSPKASVWQNASDKWVMRLSKAKDSLDKQIEKSGPNQQLHDLQSSLQDMTASCDPDNMNRVKGLMFDLLVEHSKLRHHWVSRAFLGARIGFEQTYKDISLEDLFADGTHKKMGLSGLELKQFLKGDSIGSEITIARSWSDPDIWKPLGIRVIKKKDPFLSKRGALNEVGVPIYTLFSIDPT